MQLQHEGINLFSQACSPQMICLAAWSSLPVDICFLYPRAKSSRPAEVLTIVLHIDLPLARVFEVFIGATRS